MRPWPELRAHLARYVAVTEARWRAALSTRLVTNLVCLTGEPEESDLLAGIRAAIANASAEDFARISPPDDGLALDIARSALELYEWVDGEWFDPDDPDTSGQASNAFHAALRKELDEVDAQLRERWRAATLLEHELAALASGERSFWPLQSGGNLHDWLRGWQAQAAERTGVPAGDLPDLTSSEPDRPAFTLLDAPQAIDDVAYMIRRRAAWAMLQFELEL